MRRSRTILCDCLEHVTSNDSESHNNNNSNYYYYNYDNDYDAVIMTKVIVRVHAVHLMNAD